MESSSNITEKSINKSTLIATNLTFDSSRLPLDIPSNKSQTKDTKRIKKQFNIIIIQNITEHNEHSE